jgi:hypothetical protein
MYKILSLILLGLLIGFSSTKGDKHQIVRLLDVFLIGPLQIYVGIVLYNQNFNIILTALTIFIGASTISYNLRNYLEIRKKQSKEAENSN